MAVKNYPDTHLKKTLLKGSPHKMSKEEEARFVKLLKKHGKNYKLIEAKMPTKTLAQVRNFGRSIYLEIKKNPRHRHKALFKKLRPK